VTTPGRNQTRSLEFARNQRYARATDTYQGGEEFLGEGQVIGLEQIATLKKPSANALMGGMNGIAPSNLADIGANCLVVSAQGLGERLA
jgi:hypothetical protein